MKKLNLIAVMLVALGGLAGCGSENMQIGRTCAFGIQELPEDDVGIPASEEPEEIEEVDPETIEPETEPEREPEAPQEAEDETSDPEPLPIPQ